MTELWCWFKANLITILVVVGTLLPIIFYFFPYGREYRTLEIANLENVEILATPERLKSETLRLLYDNEAVSNLVSLKIRFRNGGTLPIKEDDFFEKLRVIFPTDTQIIKYTLFQVQPRNEELFGAVQKSSSNVLILNTPLLNPGEIFDLEVLTTRQGEIKELGYMPDEIKYDFRLYGIAKEKRVEKIDTNLDRKIIALENFHKALKVFTNIIAPTGIALLFVALIADTPLFKKDPDSSHSIILPNSRKIFFLMGIIFWGTIMFALFYLIGTTLYDAFVLPV